MTRTASSTSNSERSVLRRLALRGVLLLPLLAIVAGVNFVVDPAHRFDREGFERDLAEILVSGRNVGNVSNFDERLVHKYFIALDRRDPDIAIFGSSRSMLAGGSSIPGHVVANNSVSSASIRDIAGLVYGYLEKDRLPRQMIFALDPWLLDSESDSSRWVSILPEVNAAYTQLKIRDPNLPPVAKLSWRQRFSDRWINLFSLSYFQAALRRLREDRHEYFPTEETVAKYSIILADGSFSYALAYRNRTVEDVRERAITYADAPVRSFKRLDPYARGVLERLVLLLQSRGVLVRFYFPPFHPATIERLRVRPEYQRMFEANDWLLALAKRRGVPVMGSIYPEEAGVKDEDFIDGIHLNAGGIRKAFTRTSFDLRPTAP